MTELFAHPLAPFLVALALVPWVGEAGRRVLAVVTPLVGLASLAALPEGARMALDLAGHEWVLLRFDGLARMFAVAFLTYGAIAGVYAWREPGAGPRLASLGLTAAGVGVALAGDLLTLFLFWEWLTVASLFLVWFGRRPASFAAGMRYLLLHLAGAAVLLSGILLLMAEGVTAFEQLPPLGEGGLASALILGGFLVNAAVPPLNAWLPDAYPRATLYGTTFLAAFTTKGAVYALCRGFPGTELLIWAGAAMALFGVVYAVLENDIRRLLSYHIISQVGFMVCGVGLGTALSLNGASSHAFAHIFYKGLLLMSAGAILYATGRSRLSELGRLSGPLRWTMIWMIIGSLSIAGAPLFNGYVTKSMVLSAAAYEGRAPIEFLLLVASMGTFLSIGLKLVWFGFYGQDNGARVERAVPFSMHLAMGIGALLCLVTGLFPSATIYALMPFDATYAPFTGHHFVEVMQLLVGTALGFWLLLGVLKPKVASTRDVDRIYRGPLAWFVRATGTSLQRAGQTLLTLNVGTVRGTWRMLHAYHAQAGLSTLATQGMIVVTAVALAAWAAVALAS